MKAAVAAIQTDQLLNVCIEYGDESDLVLHPELVKRILIAVKDSNKITLRNVELAAVYANSDGKFYWTAVMSLEEKPLDVIVSIETIDGLNVPAECEIVQKADTITGKMF